MYGGGLISFLGDNLVIFQMIVWESIFRAANWSEKSSQYPNLDNLANIARIEPEFLVLLKKFIFPLNSILNMNTGQKNA